MNIFYPISECQQNKNKYLQKKEKKMESGKKSSSLRYYRIPPLIGDPQDRLIWRLQIYIGDPQIFIRNSQIFYWKSSDFY